MKVPEESKPSSSRHLTGPGWTGVTLEVAAWLGWEDGYNIAMLRVCNECSGSVSPGSRMYRQIVCEGSSTDPLAHNMESMWHACHFHQFDMESMLIPHCVPSGY